MNNKVLIVMGSDSDLPKLEPCFNCLNDFGIAWEATVCSAHRSPDRAAALAKGAAANGFGVIIAAAGLAAHLPGVLAAMTVLPVIGIPISAGALKGVDALLAEVQMPPGIPVATVGIDGAFNAAVLAAQILAVADSALADRLNQFKQKLAVGVSEKDAALQEKLGKN
jgi:5-(carboxyamino)imidazole ribonucleotide mutase